MICKTCKQNNNHYAHGLCSKCYNSWKSKQDRSNLIDCPECHKKKPIGSRGLCENCYAKWRRKNNPKRFQEIDKARWPKRRNKENKRRRKHYENNKVNHLAKSKIYHQIHYNEIKEQQKKYRARNIEKIRTRNRIYSKTKRDMVKQISRLRAWTAKQPKEKIRALWVRQTARRTARKNSLPSTLTRQEWEQIKSKFGNRCVYCWKEFRNLAQDHVIPVSRGGGYTADNIVPACKSCNSKKGTMTAEEFIQKIISEK